MNGLTKSEIAWLAAIKSVNKTDRKTAANFARIWLRNARSANTKSRRRNALRTVKFLYQ